MIDETETSEPERPDLGPLLGVIFSRDLEGTPHPPEITLTFWALGCGLFGSLPRFPAVEASVRPEAFRTMRQRRGDDRRQFAVAQRAAKFHPFRLGGAAGHYRCMRQPIYVCKSGESCD
jgi:hypothetical protein